MSEVRILCIDGGGIRGLIPALVLEELERRLGCPVADVFHMVAGVSSGSLIAAGLAQEQPLSGTEIVEAFRNRGEDMFSAPFWRRVRTLNGLLNAKYDACVFEEQLDDLYGDACLSDCKLDFLATAYDIENRQTQVFKSWKACGRSLTSRQTAARADYLLRDVVRASTAAPTYFEPAWITSRGEKKPKALIDGGLSSNNPASMAVAAARILYPNATSICMVSLGTGKVVRPFPYSEARVWGMLRWINPVLSILYDAMDETVDYQVARELRKDTYFRLQIDLARRISDQPAPSDRLDDTRPANIDRLTRRFELLRTEQAVLLDQIVARLKQPRAAFEELYA